jgi:hypothetical protein
VLPERASAKISSSLPHYSYVNNENRDCYRGLTGHRSRPSESLFGKSINTVSPGIIRTPMHKAETHDYLKSFQPMGRMGEVDEVVDAVIYLDDAMFVTGEVLHIDGGAHAGKW